MPKRFRPLGSFNCADALALGSGAARVVQTFFIHWDFARGLGYFLSIGVRETAILELKGPDRGEASMRNPFDNGGASGAMQAKNESISKASSMSSASVFPNPDVSLI